jgi:hypothetical protein
MQLGLDRARIPPCDAQHQSTQRHLGHLDQGVNVIGHEAVAMHPCIESGDYFSDEVRHDLAVMSDMKNVLPVIARQRDVIEHARHMQTQRSRHPCLR